MIGLMFKFSLPKISRPSPIVLLLIFVLLVLATEGGFYYYLKTTRKAPLNVSLEVAEKGKQGLEEHEKLKEEIKNQQKEIKKEKPVLTEKCLYVSLDNPKNGIYRLSKIGENVFDYFYRGKVLNVEKKTEGDCVYVSLHLKEAGEFTLILPSTLAAKTDLGEVYPIIYEDHLGQRVEIKIRYQQDSADPKLFKTIEWQPLVFLVD